MLAAGEARFGKGGYGMVQIAASYFFCFLIYGIMVPLMSPVLLEMGYTKTSVGLIQAGIYCTGVVVPIVSTRISDLHLSQERFIRLTAITMTMASLVMWHTSSRPGWLFIAGLLGMAAMRAPQVPLQDALAMQVASNQPGRFARMRQAGSVGFALAAIVMGYLSEGLGLQIFFPAMTLAILLYTVNSFFLPTEEKEPKSPEKSAFWFNLNRSWWFWLLALFCHWVCFAPYHYGFTILLTEAKVPLSISGWMWTIGVAAEIVFFLFSGRFFDRLGFRGVLILAFCANLIRWTLVGLFPNGWVIAFSQLLHGPGFALYYAAVLQGIYHYCGGRQRASYQGLYATIVAGGATILGMLLCGELYERMPFASVFLAMVPLQILGLVVLYLNHLSPPAPLRRET